MSEKTKITSQVELVELPSGFINLRLGEAHEKVITLNESRLESLKSSLKLLASRRVPGIIISGNSDQMFTVGADINLINSVTSAEHGKQLAQRGQEIFDLIADLDCPSVAAISGPCVGGGCELALACDYRIISDHKSSIIGLPEVNLGILPGFGGTQRLPRLLGIVKALDVILNAKVLRAQAAFKIGLVDKITTPENLFREAEKLLSTGKKLRKLKILDKLLTNTSLGRLIVEKKSTAVIKAKTKGFYPAPVAALSSCLYGLQHGIKAGLEYEAVELGKLIISPESKALVNVFFLTESAKSLGKNAISEIKDLNLAVVGAGIMGAGIASLLLKNNYPVSLLDNSEANLEKGKQFIQQQINSIKYLSAEEKTAILNKLRLGTNENCNFIIEAVVERLDIKRDIFKNLTNNLADDAIMASNTSSLAIGSISDGLKKPDRFVGMHFFNPVDKMPLIEIIRSKETSNKTLMLTAALTVKLGKFPIVVSDVAGFLINRILSPYINEALFLLSEGYSIEQIDRVAKKFGMPMGPFRLLDKVGLDVAAHVAQTMQDAYGKRMDSPNYPKTLVAQNLLGEKNGKGFYNYAEKKEVVDKNIYKILNIKTAGAGVDLKAAEQRLVFSLINEALLCLEEGVAGEPSLEAVRQIDLGTVMGMGFPAFRGGVLYYARSLGVDEVKNTLSRLNRQFGTRFTLAKNFNLDF